jgi:integrase
VPRSRGWGGVGEGFASGPVSSKSPRRYGSGSVYVKYGAYYGRWVTADGGRANRRLGPMRSPGATEGLTRKQAENRLRELIDEVRTVSRADRTVADVGAALLVQLEALGRSKSHRETVESHVRVHIVPAFGNIAIDRLEEEHVMRLAAKLRRAGKAPKTIRNVLSTVHSICELAVRRRWCSTNPCRFVDAPAAPEAEDIRYLTQPELERLLQQGVASDSWWRLERTLYLTAAMTGLRQGELIGLRWRDIDWLGQRIRVRQTYVRGEFKAPKSRRGRRGVPMAIRVARELEAYFLSSVFQGDDDLVFANPSTGGPLDRSKVRKRFQAACRRAGVRVVRFHDLRHTFGTRVAASGDVSLRTLQEWMGHRDPKTTLIYADYQPDPREAVIVSDAFGDRDDEGR